MSSSEGKQLQNSTRFGLFLLEPQPLQARADVSSAYGVGLAGACGVSMKKMSSFLGFQMRAMITLQRSMKINVFSGGVIDIDSHSLSLGLGTTTLAEVVLQSSEVPPVAAMKASFGNK